MLDATEIRLLRTHHGREYLVPAFSAREAKNVLTDQIGDVPLIDRGTLDRRIDVTPSTASLNT